MLPWFFKPKGINVILDPKNKSWEHLFIHSNIITPNINELEVLSEIAISNNDSILIACNKLIEENNFDYVIGDRVDTDIFFGKQINAITILVETGVKNFESTKSADIKLKSFSEVVSFIS